MSYGDAGGKPGETTRSQSRGVFGIDALQQAALHLADLRRGTARLRTRDLVNLLLAHAARGRRASLARATVRLRVHAPDGEVAVALSI
jgi:hypothetical protein